MIVAYRRRTVPPLDDCRHALPPFIPQLTRSAFHRCLQRRGILRLPDVQGDKSKRRTSRRYPIGFFHTGIAEVQTAEGKRVSFGRTAWEFPGHLLEAVPDQIHAILADDGIPFAEKPWNRNTVHARSMRFDRIRGANGS